MARPPSSTPTPRRRPARAGWAGDDPTPPRISTLLLGMLAIALIGLGFAAVLTLVSAVG
ncbi:hypothetical protein [Xanthobacter sp. ZOL 2024]